MTFFRWSKTAGANATADPSINFAEGQAPSSVNDSARALMAAAAKYRDDMGYSGTTTGTGAAYVLATNQNLSSVSSPAWVNGYTFTFLAHATSVAGATIAVDGLAAKPLRLTSGTPLAASDILVGTLRTGTYLSATDEVLIRSPVDAGAAVLAAAIPSGATFDYVGVVAPTGYVMCAGKTIGDALSGGTERANADTSALFQLLWNSMTNVEAPVTGGRGSSAAADFAAHKSITVPDSRGRAIIGKDDMGGAAAGRITSAGSGVNGALLGTGGGAEAITLTVPQIPSHGHSVIDPGHQHDHFDSKFSGNGLYNYGTSSRGASPTAIAYTGITIGTTGGGGAHSNVQPVLILNKIIKL
jgi:microcystin-dependent protein